MTIQNQQSKFYIPYTYGMREFADSQKPDSVARIIMNVSKRFDLFHPDVDMARRGLIHMLEKLVTDDRYSRFVLRTVLNVWLSLRVAYIKYPTSHDDDFLSLAATRYKIWFPLTKIVPDFLIGNKKPSRVILVEFDKDYVYGDPPCVNARDYWMLQHHGSSLIQFYDDEDVLMFDKLTQKSSVVWQHDATKDLMDGLEIINLVINDRAMCNKFDLEQGELI